MQSAVIVVSDNETTLVTAQVLREMTITKEAIAKRQKESVLDSLMSSMVRQATEAGNTSYAANLNPQFDPVMLAEIVTELQTLGYTVTTEAKNDEKLGAFITLSINW
jgi:hypothetical protein